MFLSPPARIVKCVSKYIFFNPKMFNSKKKKRRESERAKRQKVNETKKVKGISEENLTGFDDIMCEFVLCTLNLLYRVNFFALFI